jgi:hypothetical protein
MTIRQRTVSKPIETYADLQQATAAKGDVMIITMMKLRDIHGAGKLGVHVTQSMSDKLKSMGLGHFPEELPQQQSEEVRIYVRGSAIGKLIEAVLTVDASSNKILREAASNQNNDIVQKIRELVE